MENDILEALKSAWGWVGIRPQKLYWINKFGNLIIKDQAGCYWLLRPEDLSCKIIAWTDIEIKNLWKDNDFIVDWEMFSLGEQAEAEFGKNEEGACFYFVISPVLGGEYELSNIRTITIIELIISSGDMAEQIKDLPNGAKVKLVVKD